MKNDPYSPHSINRNKFCVEGLNYEKLYFKIFRKEYVYYFRVRQEFLQLGINRVNDKED